MKYGYFLAEALVARVLPPDAVLRLRQAATNPDPGAVDRAVEDVKTKYPGFFRTDEPAFDVNREFRRKILHLNQE